MATQGSRLTKILFCKLDEEFSYLEQTLERLQFDSDSLGEFKLFCDSATAVEFFKYPAKTEYKGIPVVMVTDFPGGVCMVVRSTEYVD